MWSAPYRSGDDVESRWMPSYADRFASQSGCTYIAEPAALDRYIESKRGGYHSVLSRTIQGANVLHGRTRTVTLSVS